MNISFNLDHLAAFAAIFSTIVAALAAGLVLIQSRRNSRYDEELKRAELSLVRSSLEAEIGKLNQQLTASDQRWREVNHLLVSSQSKSVAVTKSEAERTRFLRLFSLSENDFEVDRRLVFVLTPFNEEASEVFQSIKAACEIAGLQAVRGDEEHAQGDILTHIIKLMCRARLVIANVGTRNPNVFYELGIAQAIGKPTILVAEHPSAVPFDIRSLRILTFTNPNELKEVLPPVLVKLALNESL